MTQINNLLLEINDLLLFRLIGFYIFAHSKFVDIGSGCTLIFFPTQCYFVIFYNYRSGPPLTTTPLRLEVPKFKANPHTNTFFIYFFRHLLYLILEEACTEYFLKKLKTQAGGAL